MEKAIEVSSYSLSGNFDFRLPQACLVADDSRKLALRMRSLVTRTCPTQRPHFHTDLPLSAARLCGNGDEVFTAMISGYQTCFLPDKLAGEQSSQTRW